MVYKANLTTFAGRLEYVWRTCGYERKAHFAKALDVPPQTLANWAKRGNYGEGDDVLHAVTAVSTDWLRTGKGIPFPSGPTMAAPTVASRGPANSAQLEQSIRELQVICGAIVSALAVNQSDAARLIQAALRNPQIPIAYREAGPIAELLKGLDASLPAARAKRPVRRR